MSLDDCRFCHSTACSFRPWTLVTDHIVRIMIMMETATTRCKPPVAASSCTETVTATDTDKISASTTTTTTITHKCTPPHPPITATGHL